MQNRTNILLPNNIYDLRKVLNNLNFQWISYFYLIDNYKTSLNCDNKLSISWQN